LTDRISPELGLWLKENVSFVSTSVDRITPRTTDRDIAIVAKETRWLDGAPVVTEPFASWVISVIFRRAGRNGNRPERCSSMTSSRTSEGNYGS